MRVTVRISPAAIGEVGDDPIAAWGDGSAPGGTATPGTSRTDRSLPSSTSAGDRSCAAVRTRTGRAPADARPAEIVALRTTANAATVQAAATTRRSTEDSGIR